MKNILLVNRKRQNCGIYQYGVNIFNSLSKSRENNYLYLETDDENTLINFCKLNTVDIVIFNWYLHVMRWITNSTIDKLLPRDVYCIYHDDIAPSFRNIKGVFYNDPTRQVNNINEFNINRCLFDYKNTLPKDDSQIIISSFGFGFMDKGFQNVIKKANEEFSNCLIRLHIPDASVDHNNQLKNQTLRECYEMMRNHNQLVVTSNYMDNNEVLNWLSESTINCFFYDLKPSNGISSVIDYSLSVNVPIAITNCSMFRHINKKDILIEENSIKEIIDMGCEPLIEFKEMWSNENFYKNIDTILS
jgi:hypothetical protein